MKRIRFAEPAPPLSDPAVLPARMESEMSEFFRSGAIMVMGVTVMAAGVFVVFYG